jgi:hypothetical protein
MVRAWTSIGARLMQRRASMKPREVNRLGMVSFGMIGSSTDMLSGIALRRRPVLKLEHSGWDWRRGNSCQWQAVWRAVPWIVMLLEGSRLLAVAGQG